MSEKKCPTCKCKQFYLKNPEDQYDVYECEYKKGGPIFNNESEIPFELNNKTEVYCEACAWHDKMDTL